MWGFGGNFYWRRKEKGKAEGIVVVFAWMSSQEKHLKNYIDIYSSLGWNSFVCHSQFLNLFFPDKAASLAREVVNELVQELKIRPCPVVFASFSGGPKACMYKVIQIIEGKCEGQTNLDDYRLVRECVSGHIFDSSPVDFVSDLGTRFVLHPTVLKFSRPPPFATWLARRISATLDTLFLSRFESQRAEYWQTLYSTVGIGAPYLILCSEDDDLAPYQIIYNFATKLKDLGADVKLVKWSTSSHVGHLRYYPEEYRAAVTELLAKAAIKYSERIRQLEGEKMAMEHNQISDPFQELRKAAARSIGGLPIVDPYLNNTRTCMELNEDSNLGSEEYVPWSKMNADGHLLFDICAPKYVEDWDIRFSPSTKGIVFASGRRHLPFNRLRCIRRSRL